MLLDITSIIIIYFYNSNESKTDIITIQKNNNI